MLSVLYELVVGIILFLVAIAIIPRLLKGELVIYEILIPFFAVFLIMILLTNNLNLSLVIAAISTIVIYYFRSRKR